MIEIVYRGLGVSEVKSAHQCGEHIFDAIASPGCRNDPGLVPGGCKADEVEGGEGEHAFPAFDTFYQVTKINKVESCVY